MRLLEKSDLLRTLPTHHFDIPVKLPFRVDLRDFATWLSRRDPFSAESGEAVPANWQKSLEAFLAAQVRYHSGGIEFAQADLVAVMRLCSVLLVFDGLDEVVDIARRQEVVNEIVAGVGRLEINCGALQVIVTSRPAAFANSPGLPESRFPYFQLGSVTRHLIDEYADKWLRARGLLGRREGSEVKRILKDKLDQPHLRELAKNPMQLTILLSLIHTRGSSLPDKRTALYDNYVDLFFNREAEKNSIVREHRDLLINIHRYLAWVLHSEAEQGSNSGRLTETRLHKLLKEYLANEGYDPSLSTVLFTGMVERVVALVSRVEGTYEFEVQPLREYFAARYLYDTAPYSPVGNEKRGTLPDRFNAIARDFYWLNVTRFYAGCYSKGELASLIESLRELMEEDGYRLISHPRILAATLLSDWVFTQHPKSVQEVIELVLDSIGLRYVLASDSRRVRSGNPLILPKGGGKDELLNHCFEMLLDIPPRDFALDVIDLIKANGTPEEISHRWFATIQEQESSNRIHWLEYGLYLGCLGDLPLDRLLDIVHDTHSGKSVEVLIRANRFDYCELSEENYAEAVNSLLRRDSTMRRFQNGQTGLEIFGQSISVNRYASAFNSPQPIPLPESWNREFRFSGEQVHFIEHLEDEAIKWPNFAEVSKCRQLVEIANQVVKRTAQEWATEITSWDSIVEIGRSTWGEQWAFLQIANVSSGIKSQSETYKEFSDLLDNSMSLCKRTRYARLRAGTPNWWRRQFELAGSISDTMLCALVFMTWGSTNSITQLIDVIDNAVVSLSDDDWHRLHNAVREAVILTRQARDRFAAIEPDALPKVLDAKTVTLLALRTKNAHKLYLRYLTDYMGPDTRVLEFCQNNALNLLGSNQVSWQATLNAIAKSYQKGAISERYAARIFARRTTQEQLPEDIAKEVLSNPSLYPSFLVSAAEAQYRNLVASRIVPVGKIAEQDKWF